MPPLQGENTGAIPVGATISAYTFSGPTSLGYLTINDIPGEFLARWIGAFIYQLG